MERTSFMGGVRRPPFLCSQKNKYLSLRTPAFRAAKLIMRRSTPVLALKNSQQRTTVLFLCPQRNEYVSLRTTAMRLGIFVEEPMRGSSCFTEKERTLDEPFFFYVGEPKDSWAQRGH